jgi:ABC-type Zn uptake system ZnuABC Zn-binding protein ZnuA
LRCAPLIILLLGVFAGCGGAGAASGSGKDVEVVATTTEAADLVRNVAGDRAGVRSLLDVRTDPHDYEVRPHDVEALAYASLIVRSGGEIDAWLEGAIDGSGSGAEVVDLIDSIDPLAGSAHGGEHQEGGAESADEVDPHWWQDPGNAAKAVVAIRDALTQADPEGRAEYAANADAYVARLDKLTDALTRCVSAVPAGSRKLVTTHDALGYYARRFGFEIVGTVIPSRSTRGQASAGETADLIAKIRRENVPAIFAEQAVNADVEKAIADETGARVGDPLWTDTLGPPGSGAETYLGAMVVNTRAIVEGLTGGLQTCSAQP